MGCKAVKMYTKLSSTLTSIKKVCAKLFDLNSKNFIKNQNYHKTFNKTSEEIYNYVGTIKEHSFELLDENTKSGSSRKFKGKNISEEGQF